MPNYLREQSVEEIIRGTIEIYGSNFFIVFFTYFLLVFPFSALLEMAEAATGVASLWWIGAFVIYLCIDSLASAVITVSVSDICLGNKPSVWRAYRRVFGAFLGKLLCTSLLLVAMILIGVIFLIVPGLIFLAWWLFVGPVTILEGRWGFKALQRSKALGKGYYLRNGGMFIVLVTLQVLIVAVLEIVSSRMAPGLSFMAPWIIDVCVVSLFSELFAPILLISVVLMYYDVRVRKEAYDNAALAEDLKH